MIYDALRGLDVDLRDYRVPGHGGRGITPRGVLEHHTASNANAGDLPSLSTCIHGRPDVPGPLCQVLIGRAGTVAVITDGRANHAGTGAWRGITDGNGQLIGIEIENNGRGEPWSLGVLSVAARVTARLCEVFGLGIVIGHKEWTPRKIDPTFDMDQFRNAVTAIRTAAVPVVAVEEDDMYFVKVPTLAGFDIYQVYRHEATGLLVRRPVVGTEWAALRHKYEAQLVTAPWEDIAPLAVAPGI